MDAQNAYAWLLSRSKAIAQMDSMRSLLHWDQRTTMPPKGHAHRAAQTAFLVKLIHARMVEPETGDRLAIVEASSMVNDPLSAEAVNIREWRRSFDRASKIPERLAVELAQAASEGETVWEAARAANDWPAFKPCLKKIIDLKREEADLLGIGEEPYDALLDDYEPGETTRSLEPIFSELRDSLAIILGRIEKSSGRPDGSIAHRHFPLVSQEIFAGEVLRQLGYDLEAGRLDVSAHPFTVGIGPGDVRITTRYDERFFSMAFFGTVHEAGHALYDMGLPPEHWGTPRGQAVSLGIHESQSRTWENLVCRSRGFWIYFYPEARKHFSALSDVSVDTFLASINNVQPSLIRTEADEATYNLHVLLRFELEIALFRREISVDDLPEAWNEKMQKYLGQAPPDYARGVMQDIHWSGGAFGYFPTYTLGNMYAAQFFAQAQRDVGNLEELFSRGDFSTFLNWLRENIHCRGSQYLPRELVRAVTGEDLNPGYLTSYIKQKYDAIYG